jgi:hypothetical protein
MTSTFAAWSKQTVAPPIIPPKKSPIMGLTIRVMPAAFKWQPFTIKDGEPSASIDLNHADIRYPRPLDADGEPTPACRDFLVQVVRNAMRNNGLRMWITWPDLSSTSFTGSDLTPHLRLPPA